MRIMQGSAEWSLDIRQGSVKEEEMKACQLAACLKTEIYLYRSKLELFYKNETKEFILCISKLE